MKTLIINGSPNARKGNSDILCRCFVKGMSAQLEIRYAAEEDPRVLADYMDEFDSWLFFFPLYTNAMPGILKRLFEYMRPDQKKSAGYFVQSGFEEAAQSDYLCAILRNLNKRMGYQDLGLVVAGGMAGVRYMPPWMNRKVFARLERAGMLYEQNGAFAEETIRVFGKRYRYTAFQLKRNRFLHKTGITDIFWNSMLKKNDAFDKRFDKPFGI